MRRSFLTIMGAERELGIPQTLLRSLVKNGKIPYEMSGSRVYIRRDVLENLGRGEQSSDTKSE